MTEALPVVQRRIAVNDGTLFVEIAGSGDDLLLLHSGITDRRMWDDQFFALAERYRVVRYDLRGFGESSDVTGLYSHTEDLSAIVKELNLQELRVVAASLGARIAVDFAVAHPDRFQSMVLVGPAISGVRFEDMQLRECWSLMGEAWDRGDFEQVVQLETKIWINGPERPSGTENQAAIDRVLAMQREILAREPEEEFEREDDPPASGRLTELAMPILVVVGEYDVSDIHRNAHRIVSDARSAEMVVIPGTGHLPNLEEPASFNEIVLDFLNRGPGR